MSEIKPYVVAGKVMVTNKAGEYLFLKRSAESKHFKSQWEMPGGKMDPGETLEDCLVRETREETGLDVAIVHVLGSSEGEIPTFRLAYLILSAEIIGSDTVTLSDEHDDYKWVTPTAAMDLDLCPAFVSFIKSII